MGVITHAKVSGKPNGPDPALVGGEDWDAEHVIAPGTVDTTDLGGDITAAGKALLDDADAAAQRTTLGLGTAAVEDVGDFEAAGAVATHAALTSGVHGISAYGATLVDDADAAAARTTLGLAAVAASGSASDLGTGTLPAARIGAASIEDTKLATSATKGRFLGRQILTGSGTYTPTSGTCIVHMRAIGGGGGGGGAAPGTGVGAAAGGSSGVLLDIVIGTAGVALTGGGYAGGTAGSAGAATPTAGGTGGDTTITIGGTLYTIKGGGGGTAMTGVAGDGTVFSSAPAAGTSSGGITTFSLGGPGIVDDGTIWYSGYGGTTALGAGGAPVSGTVVGNAGTGYGSGGSGGSASSGSRAGGAGAAGCIIIDEYT